MGSDITGRTFLQQAAAAVAAPYIVPAGDVGCPPQPDMPVPSELDYEGWQGPAPRACLRGRKLRRVESSRARSK